MYVKQGKYGDILQDHARQIKLRAEGKGGLLLDEMELAKGGRPSEEPVSHDQPVSAPTLSDQGLSKDQSIKWRKIASIPEDEYKAAVEQAKSEAHLLRMAKAREQAEAQAARTNPSRQADGQETQRRNTAKYSQRHLWTRRSPFDQT